MTEQLVVYPQLGPLRGSVPLPVHEQSLLPRLALSVVSRGKSTFVAPEESVSVRVFCDALALFGVTSERDGKSRVVVGTGLNGLVAASGPVDVRGEAHVAALLVGLLAGRSFESELWVDAPVAELLGPVLVEFELARVEPLEEGARFVLVARSGRPPGIELTTTGIYAWVKQALLLIALRADEPTLVDEKLASADHLERAFERARVPLEIVGSQMVVHPPRDADALGPQTWEHPGSLELAAYLGVLGFVVPESEIVVRNVSTNPTGASFLSLARAIGGRTGTSPRADQSGEPASDLTFAGSTLTPRELSGESMLHVGDGVLPLAVALTRAPGVSTLTDIAPERRGGDLRVLSRLVGYLRTAGVNADLTQAGLVVVGDPKKRLAPLEVTTGGDARLALVGTLLGLLADGPSVIDDVACLRDLFPRWVGTLRALGAHVEVRTIR